MKECENGTVLCITVVIMNRYTSSQAQSGFGFLFAKSVKGLVCPNLPLELSYPNLRSVHSLQYCVTRSQSISNRFGLPGISQSRLYLSEIRHMVFSLFECGISLYFDSF